MYRSNYSILAFPFTLHYIISTLKSDLCNISLHILSILRNEINMVLSAIEYRSRWNSGPLTFNTQILM